MNAPARADRPLRAGYNASMSYEVFARKLRPKGFDALVGQDHVVKALTHALDHDRLHHAYLFTGTRGVGKTTIARILARCLNCETAGVSSTPCGSCAACSEINDGRFVDLIEVDAASRTGVADTRELLENAQYLPTRGRYKVYLIDEVHMLSTAAFNALLKTLEEPPPHIVFLLATTEAKKVPVTVLSRCLQFQLKNIPAEQIAAYLGQVLQADDVAFDDEALATIARSARGSMRDALSITDQAIAFGQGSLSASAVQDMLGVVGRNEVAGLLEALAAEDAAAVLQVTADFASRGIDFASVLEELLGAFHTLAVDAAVQGAKAAGGFSAEALHLNYQIALMGHRDLVISPDPQAGMEMTLLRMLAFAPEPGSSVPRGSGGQAAAPDAETDVGTEAAPASAAPDTPAVSPATPTAAPERLADWYAWVAQAPVQGVARMLLEHSALQALDGDVLHVVLDSRHDTLLNDAQVQAMERALTEVLGRSLRIDLQVGTPAYETPALRLARLQKERQQEAERAIQEDATVQALLRDFGGTVQRVQPLDG